MHQDNVQLNLTKDQLNQLLGKLGIKGVSPDQIMDKAFDRISAALVKEDLDQIKILNETDNQLGDKVREFILTKVPNLDKIVQEETVLFSSTYASS